MADPRPSESLPLVRRLWPSDRQAILDYFRRLDAETRANRFMGQVSETGLLAYAEQAMTARGVMYGAFLDGTLRGLGELRPGGGGRSSYYLGPQAEAAFAVEREFRRRDWAPPSLPESPRPRATAASAISTFAASPATDR